MATASGVPAVELLATNQLDQHLTDYPQSSRRIQEELKDVSLLSGGLPKKQSRLSRKTSSRPGVKPSPSWGRARFALIRTVDLDDQAVHTSSYMLVCPCPNELTLLSVRLAGHHLSHRAQGLAFNSFGWLAIIHRRAARQSVHLSPCNSPRWW